MTRRQECLSELIHIGEGYEKAKEELATMPWDCEVPEIVLTLNDTFEIMKRFINGQIAAALLEDWADSIELRDDIGYEESNRAKIKEIIFSLANPELTNPITIASVASLMKTISQ
jgi:hypothetical protein